MSIEKEKSNYKQLFMDYCKDKIKNLGNITVDEEIMEDSYINDTKILYVLPNVRGCEYVNVLRDDEGGAIWVSPEGNIVLEAGGMASANDDIVELKFTAIDKEYYEEILKYWSEYYFDEMMEREEIDKAQRKKIEKEFKLPEPFKYNVISRNGGADVEIYTPNISDLRATTTTMKGTKHIQEWFDIDGLWQVNLECTQKAMRYFFNIENLGYLRYKLRCITSIASRYSYIMFIYLESNRFRRSWEVSLSELKKILNCDTEETYKEYKRFNDRLLKRVQKELTEKTECQYKYDPIKKGRSVVSVRFTVFPLHPVVDVENEKQDAPEWERAQQDELTFMGEALDNALTPEQMNVIMSLVREIDIPEGDGIDRARYRFLQRQWAIIQMQNKVKPIKSKFLYLKKMLEQQQ